MTSNEIQSSNLPEQLAYRADLRVYDEQLQFAARIIDRLPITNSERLELYQYIDRIQKRRNDPILYLAVIGELSSGKSTLINALLRHDLLKTSALSATATATRLLQGKEIEVEVQFKNHHYRLFKVNDKHKVIIDRATGEFTVARLPWQGGLDLKQFIHEVTSNDILARKVTGVNIAHPALFLKTGIVIIDTPGTNAANPEHRDIVRHVVEKEADAVIITVPATQPLSNSLIDFLAKVVHPFLHRCVFLVTKIDLIQPEQQRQAIEKIKVSLQRNLGIPQPTVFPVAPQVVLDAPAGGEIPSHVEEWKVKFFELEAALKKRLRQERAIGITESGLRQLASLFASLDTHLELQCSQYSIRQEALARHALPDLQEFATQQTAICRQILEKAISTTEAACAQCVESHRESTAARIKDEMWKAPDVKTLDSIVETKANEILNQEQQFLQTSLQKNIENLLKEAINGGRYFDYKFSEVYPRLQFLGGIAQIRTTRVALNAEQAVSSVQEFYQEIVDYNFTLTVGGGGAGAVTGAALGSFMLPGIGTAIGSSLGGTIGFIVGKLFSTTLEERKEKVWERVHSTVNSYFDSVKPQALQLTREYGESATTALEERIDAYVARYKAVVSAMRDEQRKELLRLRRLQKQTEATSQEIEQRRKFLSVQLQRLSEIVVK